MRRLGLDIDPGIDEPAQGCLQARFLTDHGHVQLPLGAVVIAVGEGDQRIGKGFRMFGQGTLDGLAISGLDQVPGNAKARDQDPLCRGCR
ncbi:hypothetical protein D3C76_708110 [compost metagenome]